MADDISVAAARAVDEELVEAMRRLISQLSSTAVYRQGIASGDEAVSPTSA
jgi:hypothetical protein